MGFTVTAEIISVHLYLFVVSVVHFTPFLTGLSSVMLI